MKRLGNGINQVYGYKILEKTSEQNFNEGKLIKDSHFEIQGE